MSKHPECGQGIHDENIAKHGWCASCSLLFDKKPVNEPQKSEAEQSFETQDPLWVLDKVEVNNGIVTSAIINGVKFMPQKSEASAGLRDIYERCDVSNNRTDNPLSFEEFALLISQREAEAYEKGYIAGGIDEITRHEKARQQVEKEIGE